MNCINCKSLESVIYKCYICNCYLFCTSCYNSKGGSKEAVRIYRDFITVHFKECSKSIDIA